MATKKTSAKSKKTSSKSKSSGFVDSAVEATIELGHAAESLKDSFDHVGKAREKGRAVTSKVARTAKSATRAVTNTTKKVFKKKPAKRSRTQGKKR
jgi:hypothetical protein